MMGRNKWNMRTFLLLSVVWMACSQDDGSCDLVMVDNIPKRSGDNGYRIRIDRHPTGYVPGEQYRVLLQSTTPVSFRQFFLVATEEGDPNEPAGSFAITDRFKTRLSRTCRHAVTHAITSSKTSISAEWTAPPSGSGCVNFRAGVIQKKSVWFAEDGDLTLQLCEAAEEEPSNVTGSPDPFACCAPPDQEVKYRFTFVSTWTPDTHPRQYPTGNGNHWSDLIGASHGADYTIWDYGQYASYGIKMVAEWGSPIKLEEEIKREGENVKTVIFSRGLFPAYGPRLRNMTAFFKTDARRPLVSAVSMMGPSPDWCVGITRENLCTPDCGWVERKEFRLQPWDAGTDSGIMYNSSNSRLDPPDPIRPITSSDPDNVRAPFYDPSGAPIPPLATVILERVSHTDTEENSGPDIDSTMPPKQMGGTMPPKVMGHTMPPKVMGETMPPKVMGETMPPKVMPPNVEGIVTEGTDTQTMPPKRPGGRVVDCMMTEFGEWTECSKSCGKGKMIRQRMIKQRPRNGGVACGPTREKKTCNLGRCMSKDRSRDCRMGEWGAWSECSVSCGEGIEFRMRDIARQPRGNGAPCEALKEMRVCEAAAC